jgi:hypothetical protein
MLLVDIDRYAAAQANLEDAAAACGGVAVPDVQQRFVWHGTRKADPAVVAMHPRGLDLRVSKHGTLGRGVYVAENPLYAIHYGHFLETSAEEVAAHPANQPFDEDTYDSERDKHVYRGKWHVCSVREAGRRPVWFSPKIARPNMCACMYMDGLQVEMLLCRVLTGREKEVGCVDDLGATYAHVVKLEGGLHDSLVGTTKLCGGSRIWAVYDSAQVYTSYIVTVQIVVPCHPVTACGTVYPCGCV